MADWRAKRPQGNAHIEPPGDALDNQDFAVDGAEPFAKARWCV